MRIRRILWPLVVSALLIATGTEAAYAQREPGCYADFEESSYKVDEGVGSVTVAVTARVWGGAGPWSGGGYGVTSCGNGSVEYETIEIAREAVGDKDYRRKSGRLTFTADDDEQAISIEILEDAQAEPEEAFGIRLSNPQGEIVGTGSPTRVEIVDNDPTSREEGPPEPQADEQSGTRPGPGTQTQSQPAGSHPDSGLPSDRSEGRAVADRAPTVEGVGVAGDPDALAGQASDRGVADGWAAGLVGALILGGLVLGGLAGRSRLHRSPACRWRTRGSW